MFVCLFVFPIQELGGHQMKERGKFKTCRRKFFTLCCGVADLLVTEHCGYYMFTGAQETGKVNGK